MVLLEETHKIDEIDKNTLQIEFIALSQDCCLCEPQHT